MTAPRFAPLAWAGIRLGWKRKLPLLLLYTLPVGWMLFFSAQIFMLYGAEQGMSEIGGPMMRAMITAKRIFKITLDVKFLISTFFLYSRLFAVLLIAWFGCGLLCEDRRAGAHVLYFSRPLTRLDYVLGRWCTVFFYGALGVIVPGMFIVGSAAWMSPDWQFVRDEGEAVWGTLAFGFLTVAFYSTLSLAVSAVASKKSFAMMAMFALVLLPHALSRILARLLGERAWRVLSPLTSLGKVGNHFLDVRQQFYQWPTWWSAASLCAIMLVCCCVIAVRIRRWEVVA